MISLTANVQQTINAILADEVVPVVQPNNGKLYVLSIGNRELGNITYTIFDETMKWPEESWEVRYSAKHVIGNILFDPMPKSKLQFIVDEQIPEQPREIWTCFGLAGKGTVK